jgi:hypothetical protein
MLMVQKFSFEGFLKQLFFDLGKTVENSTNREKYFASNDEYFQKEK